MNGFLGAIAARTLGGPSALTTRRAARFEVVGRNDAGPLPGDARESIDWGREADTLDYSVGAARQQRRGRPPDSVSLPHAVDGVRPAAQPSEEPHPRAERRTGAAPRRPGAPVGQPLIVAAERSPAPRLPLVHAMPPSSAISAASDVAAGSPADIAHQGGAGLRHRSRHDPPQPTPDPVTAQGAGSAEAARLGSSAPIVVGEPSGPRLLVPPPRTQPRPGPLQPRTTTGDASAPSTNHRAAPRAEPNAPVIHVTIGRVEIRATALDGSRQPHRLQQNPGVLPLEEYLRQRKGGA